MGPICSCCPTCSESIYFIPLFHELSFMSFKLEFEWIIFESVSKSKVNSICWILKAMLHSDYVIVSSGDKGQEVLCTSLKAHCDSFSGQEQQLFRISVTFFPFPPTIIEIYCSKCALMTAPKKALLLRRVNAFYLRKNLVF